MSNIAPLASSGSSGTVPPAATKSAVDDAAAQKDMFLKLMVAQIKNQDPLNPVDSTQFTSQLAQMTSLEQLTYVREDVSKIAGIMQGPASGTTAAQETN